MRKGSADRGRASGRLLRKINMALRKIYKDGEPVLRKKSKQVTKFDARLSQLIDDMIETLKNANGIGLAAVQVGILKRVMVIDAGGETGVVELVNPEISGREGVQAYYEGCLSYPGYYGNAGRPESVTVSAYDRNGEAVTYAAKGVYAVACCHEADHLDGVMFMNKVIGSLYTLDEIKEMREKAAANKTENESGENASGRDEIGAIRRIN